MTQEQIEEMEETEDHLRRRDELKLDAFTLAGEIITAGVKTLVSFGVLRYVGHLEYEPALATGALLGMTDFFGNRKQRYRIVEDIKNKVSVTNRSGESYSSENETHRKER